MAIFFNQEVFDFLLKLKENNNREWFSDNKKNYEQHLLDPALSFINAMAEPIKKISPFYNAIPKKVGGSLFRIYRDARFSKGKSPYKTQVGIHFHHHSDKDAHAPGFYVHIEPQGCFIAAGIWQPNTEDLYKIRLWLSENYTRWQKITKKKKFANNFKLRGNSLVRPPKGFAADHAAIDLLKLKDFVAIVNISDSVVTSDDFDKTCVQMFAVAAPMMACICEALDLQF